MRLRIPGFLRTGRGLAGLICLAAPIFVALFGPFIAPHSPTEPLGLPGQYPGGDYLFGLDYLGRDVLSRSLHGGLSVLTLSLAATVISYLAGYIVGSIAGYTTSVLDPILMRTVDVLLAFPAVIVLLLIVNALGGSSWVLLLGVALIQLPGVARLVRSTTEVARVSGYVEAAVCRGERPPQIVVRDILPNIAPILLADLSLRFSQSVILIASINFLGLGLQPPASDWGLMIAENRIILASNPFASIAPALFLALLMIGVNLIGDAYSASLGVSQRRLGRRGRRTQLPTIKTLSLSTQDASESSVTQ